MSAFFDIDNHLGEIHEAALRLAPLVTSGVDFSNTRSGPGSPSDTERVAQRAWDLAIAFIEQYHRKVDEAGEREEKKPKREKIHVDYPKEVTHA
jgi:hypothetical protein